MATSVEEIRRHVRLYIMIGATLLALTLVTVLVSYVHLPLRYAVTVAITIAAFKASLVAMVFMHLKWERWDIFRILILTAVFLLALFSLPFWGDWAQVRSGGPIFAPAAGAHGPVEH